MATPFINTCPSCGAEESLDALLLRMIDDDTVRRLIADVLTASFPLGGIVVRYLRLHKPLKQQLRMDKVARLLAELVPDVQRNAIERNGRNWLVSVDDWKGAFAAVFTAVEKGTLAVPLTGNGYLYSVLMRKSDKAEGEQEAQRELDKRVRPERDTVQVRGQTMEIGAALEAVYGGKDPALAEIDARSQKAAPMTSDVRAKVAELLANKKG
ncbi:MAG: hypothetical protein K2X78_02320 [Burkholderiaceae bacterium]|nr:hypothetical protein [Burkholderiaceae bacterium]